MVTPCNSGRIMDHQHGNRGYQDGVACHGDHTGGACSDAVYLHGDFPLIVGKHIVDLCRRHAVAARRVDPHGDVARAAVQLILKKLRRDVIVKPAIFRDGAAQFQDALLRPRFLVFHFLPVPELLCLHPTPPFPVRPPLSRKAPHRLILSCSR